MSLLKNILELVNQSIFKVTSRLLLSKLNLPRDVHRFAFRRYSDQIALITPAGSYTYAQLEERVLKLSNAWFDMGLQAGDIVFCRLRDNVEQIEVRLASLESNIIVTSFHEAHLSDQVSLATKNLSPKLYIYDPKIDGEISERLKSENPELLLLKTGTESEYETCLANASTNYNESGIKLEDPISIGFTSGTTGEPKAVVSTHKAYISSLKLLIRNIRFQAIKRNYTMSGIPLVGAGSGVLLPTFLSGGTLVIPRTLELNQLVKTIESLKVSRIFITPSQLIDLLELSKSEHQKLKSLEHIIYGTAQMPVAKLTEAIKCFGSVFQQGYGMAEILPPVSLLSPAEHTANNKWASNTVLSSVGKVVSGVKVKIMDKLNNECQPGKIGSIYVSSPTMFSGYWQRPDLTEKAFDNGFMRTGDYGFLDENGYLYILDREADLIFKNGQTIYPRLVEEKVHEYPPIKEACLIEVNQKVILCISLRNRFKNLPEIEVIKGLKKFLGESNVLRFYRDRIHIVEELPRSFLGKVLRREVRAKLAMLADSSFSNQSELLIKGYGKLK